MPLHLTKVAFGCRTIEALEKRSRRAHDAGEVRVATRMRPKRADELIGGSLHWIVKHRLIARQQILRIEDRNDGRIDIVLAGALELIPPKPQARPPGLALSRRTARLPTEGDGGGLADLPPRLYVKLSALALV